MALLLFCTRVGGLEGETVQSELPVDVRDRGMALPAGKEVLLPLPKNPRSFLLGFFYPLRKQWHITSPLGLYIITPTGACISSAAGCILFRNDDIQHFVLMICNPFGIDDIHAFGVMNMRECQRVRTRDINSVWYSIKKASKLHLSIKIAEPRPQIFSFCGRVFL